MYEIFKLVISDINIYGLCIFLPSLLALIFTAIFRNDKKKLKIILAAIPSIVLCYLLFVCSFTFIYIFIICSALVILYGASIAVGFYFSNKKVILCLVAILLLPCSLLLLTTFEYYELREPFGYINDKDLPDSLSNANFDYEVKLDYADAWGNDHYTVSVRGKHLTDSSEDSIVYCKQYRMCTGVTFFFEDSASSDTQSVQATPRNICQHCHMRKKQHCFNSKNWQKNIARNTHLALYWMDIHSVSIFSTSKRKRFVHWNSGTRQISMMKSLTPRKSSILDLP